MSHIILGGGISGLSAAYYLSKTLINEIKLYESSSRVGGWIRSVKSKSGGIFEQGPRTLRVGGKASLNTLQLVDELGLLPSISPLLTQNIAAKNRMIYYDNQLISVPTTLSSLFVIRPPFVQPFIFGIMKDIKAPKVTIEDESVHDFVTRRFGEDYAENMFGALVCGIFGGDAKEISIKGIMKNIFQIEQEYGSVFRGFIYSMFKKKNEMPQIDLQLKKKMKNWFVWTFKNGLETLPIEIQNYLEQKSCVKIELEKKCSNVVFEKGKVLLTINGNVETADHLYSTLPSNELGKIIGDEHSFLKNELLSVPYVSIAVVNLEYQGDAIEKKGFGVLVPPNQNLPILGISFDSCILKQEGKTVLTVMMGGKWFKQYFGTDPDEKLLLKVAKDHVKMILNIYSEPANSLVTVLKNCIPQYVVGHSKRVQEIRDYIRKNKLPLTLIGNSFDGVGVNDAILSAKNNVEETLKELNLNNLRGLTFGYQGP